MGESPNVHRLVLLALVLPMVAIGVVIWLLLPGSAGGMAMTPSQFAREAVLQPGYWQAHDATVRGYLASAPCPGPLCGRMLLSDTPAKGSEAAWQVVVLPQREPGWHGMLRRFLPGLSSPLRASSVPAGGRENVTFAGRLVPSGRAGQGPEMQPEPL